jgi:hypothetical protein
MRDEATGAEQDFFNVFAGWVYQTSWGDGSEPEEA